MKLESGAVVGVFGLPCAGKTMVIKAIIESSREMLAYVSSGDIARRLSTETETKHMAGGNLFPYEDPLRAEIFKTVEARRAAGAEIVFLDGFPRFDDQVRWMLANQLAGHGAGALVQIHGTDLLKRAQQRARDPNDTLEVLQRRLSKQGADIQGMEEVIFRTGIPYFTVMNTELGNAVTQLAKYLGIRR